jgi:ABC-type nitrate/sulfonate/bicarbonate transport system substrate-binding protein
MSRNGATVYAPATPWMRGLIPYSMTREAQLVMRQLVKHKKRISVGRAPLTLPACGSGAGSSAVAGAGKQSFTLRIGTAPSGILSGNLGWGYENHLLLNVLRPAGVTKIAFGLFQAGPQVQAALASGAVDVAVTGDMPVLQTRGNGTPIRQIGFTGTNGHTWLVGKKNGPTTLAGLIGKKVAAPTGTIRYRVLYGLLSEGGLTGKVRISDLGTPESIAASTPRLLAGSD